MNNPLQESLTTSLRRLASLPYDDTISDTCIRALIQEATKRRYDWSTGLKPDEQIGHEKWQPGQPLPARDQNNRPLQWARFDVYQGTGHKKHKNRLLIRVRLGLTNDAHGQTVWVPDFAPFQYDACVADLINEVEGLLE